VLKNTKIIACANYGDVCTDKRDMYLAFKALNVSRTGHLSEEEFMDVYSVSKLNWKVRFHEDDLVCRHRTYAVICSQNRVPTHTHT